MTKIKKFDFNKIKDFDKIILDQEIPKVFQNELQNVYDSLKNPRSKISKHLKKYFIIRLVTMIESHLKYLMAHLIDYHKLPINHVFKDETISIQISDLSEIKKKEFSIGKIVAISYNFQNMQDVDKVFSRILGLKFFDTFVEYGKIAVRKKIILKEDIDHFQKYRGIFFEMFNFRNKIVHTMYTPQKIRRKPEYFENLWDVSYHFITLAFSLAESVCSFKEGKLRDKELARLFSKKADIVISPYTLKKE